jgi:hypothetical protein
MKSITGNISDGQRNDVNRNSFKINHLRVFSQREKKRENPIDYLDMVGVRGSIPLAPTIS